MEREIKSTSERGARRLVGVGEREISKTERERKIMHITEHDCCIFGDGCTFLIDD
jgi:hypothetical protein